MSTQQATLEGEFFELEPEEDDESSESETRSCPLCDEDEIPISQFPRHLMKDCESDAKKVNYDYQRN